MESRTTQDVVDRWHDYVRTQDLAILDGLLADDVVFHSPVVHTPQVGRDITRKYLVAALHVLGTPSFRYVREIVGPRDALLEFVVDIDGVTVNGIDLFAWDDDGRIVDFKVMVRPLKAVNALHQAMGTMLARGGAVSS